MASDAAVVGDRDVSAGRVFGRAFGTIGHNPAVTLGLALLFGALPGVLLTYIMSMARSDALAEGDTAVIAGFFGLTVLAALAGVVIAALVQGVLVKATVAESENRRASFGECFAAAVPVILPLIGLSILLAIGIAIGFILLIVPGVILYVMWSVAAPALVQERQGVFAAFGRSRELTKGARWRIFGILLVLLVIYYLISIIAAVLSSGLFGQSMEQAAAVGELPLGFLIFSILLGTVSNVIWGTVQASLYVELRHWKDGPAVQNLADVFS